MVVAEKLRAICQQMPEYRLIVRKNMAGRARDFVDIFLMIKEFRINLSNPSVHVTLKRVFGAKRVPLNLLGEISAHREDHRLDFAAVAATVSTEFDLEDFDFYVDHVIRECRQLESLWNV